MTIKKLKASFGSLSGSELQLEKGLNVITAPNEAGKSTWMAFIRAMFYGIDSSQRDKGGILADKNKYRPWSGAVMEGTMELEAAGRDIIITRGTAAANAPMKKFSAVYADTGDDLADISGESAGVRLLGVEQEVFRRSCFIGQRAMGVDRAPELEKRIQALVTSGDETTSYTEADARLREWERKINYTRSGELPKVKEQIEEIREKLSRQQEMNKASGELRSRIRRLGDAKTHLEKDVFLNEQISNARDVKKRYEASIAKQAALDEKTAADESLGRFEKIPFRSQVEESGAHLRMWREQEEQRAKDAEILAQLKEQEMQAAAALEKGGAYEGLSARQAWDKGRADSEKGETLLAGSKAVGLTILAAVLLVLGAVLAVAVFSFMPMAAYAGAAVAVAGIVLGVVSLVKKNKAKKALEELLRANDAKTPGDILENAKSYGEKCAALEQAQQRSSEQEKALEDLCSRQEELFRQAAAPAKAAGCTVDTDEDIHRANGEILELLNRQAAAGEKLRQAEQVCHVVGSYNGEELVDEESIERPTMPKERAMTELAETRVQLENCVQELARKDGAVMEIGDPAYLAASLEELCARRDELQLRLEAVQGAVEVLRDADRKVRARFSPILNKRAGELLRQLTKGRYDTLMLDREFAAQAVSKKDAVARDMAYLSAGTVDQIYLATRLAVCDLVLSQERGIPVILDDALVYFDDERMQAALDTLMEYAADRQVILFSCQKREAEYLKGKAGVNIVEI